MNTKEIREILQDCACCPLGAVILGKARLSHKKKPRFWEMPHIDDFIGFPGLENHKDFLQGIMEDWDSATPKREARSINKVSYHPVTNAFFQMGLDTLLRIRKTRQKRGW